MPGFRWSPRKRLRTTGRPTSWNGASSFHLSWVLEPASPLVEVSAVLEVLVPPMWASSGTVGVEAAGP